MPLLAPVTSAMVSVFVMSPASGRVRVRSRAVPSLGLAVPGTTAYAEACWTGEPSGAGHRPAPGPEPAGSGARSACRSGERRRVRGLRREEVADARRGERGLRRPAGAGSGAAAVPAGAHRLGRALRMDVDERNELFTLAGHAPPRPGTINEVVRPSVLRLLDRLADLPAVVVSAKSDLLAWNAQFAALMGDWSQVPVRQRNLIWQRFLGANAGRVAVSSDERGPTDAQSAAALRAALAKYPARPRAARPGRRAAVGQRRVRAALARGWRRSLAQPPQDHRPPEPGSAAAGLRLAAPARRRPDGDRLLRRARLARRPMPWPCCG